MFAQVNVLPAGLPEHGVGPDAAGDPLLLPHDDRERSYPQPKVNRRSYIKEKAICLSS